MSSTATNIKRSPSRTPSLGTPPQTPRTAAKKFIAADLSSGEPQIKQELEQWKNIVFSFSMEENNGRSSGQQYPGDQSSGDTPSFTTPWDIHPFFSAAPYSQQSAYDMLGLEAMNTIPPPNLHASAHSIPDPFGNTWDLGLHAGIPAGSQIHPLTPAEIAQYHALLARGAGNFPLHSLDAPQSTQALEVTSSSPPTATQTPTRGRSTSSAGRSPSHGLPSGSNVTDEEVVAITEDKRRRNIVHIARFRVKKKQRTIELERALVELEGRADELEKEAVELRRENGWLKEMVILKGRKAMENVQTAKSVTGAGPSGSGVQDNANDNDQEGHSTDKGKGKSKET